VAAAGILAVVIPVAADDAEAEAVAVGPAEVLAIVARNTSKESAI